MDGHHLTDLSPDPQAEKEELERELFKQVELRKKAREKPIELPPADWDMKAFAQAFAALTTKPGGGLLIRNGTAPDSIAVSWMWYTGEHEHKSVVLQVLPRDIPAALIQLNELVGRVETGEKGIAKKNYRRARAAARYEQWKAEHGDESA